MINQLIVKFQQVPKLLFGFIVIVAVLIFMVFNNPPKTLCEIQMQEISERLSKRFIRGNDRGKFESKVTEALEICMASNSPGACKDIFDRFNFLEGVVRTLPTECGSHPSSAKIKGFLHEAIRLFGKIAWGDTTPINRYNTTAWLDTSDLGLYCRIKRQYFRLYGKQAWKGYVQKVARSLPEAKNLRNKDLWQFSLYSYNCTGLY